MNKIPLNKLDLNLYHEVLSNGLNVYMIPNNKISNVYATYTTAYGSYDSEFIPIGGNEYIKVPDGIAHFLEHKMFEQEDGVDPFTFFSKNGADVNAYTSFFGTTYLFSGTDKFIENLKYMLNYVESPYFTDDNVEKEKDIILQELKMHKDNPYRAGEIKIIENSFVINPIRIPVIGTEQSIKSITKEDLYTCYSTFYNPSNMILVITGNFDPNETIKEIKNVEDKRKVETSDKIISKQYDEPDNVFKENDILNLSVGTPKVFIGIKINIENLLKVYDKSILFRYLNIYMNIKFGDVSQIQEDLVNKDVINTDIGIDKIYTDKHILYMIYADTNKEDEFISYILEALKDRNIDELDFIRKKKNYLASNISISDNIYSLNEKIVNEYLLNKNIITDCYEIYNKLNYEELNKIINSLDFSNISKLIIKD